MRRLLLCIVVVVVTCGLAEGATAGTMLRVAAMHQFEPWSTSPMRFDAAHDALWLIETDTNLASLVKLDPSSLAVESSTPVAVQGAAFYDLGIGLGREWVVNFPDDYTDNSLVGSVSEYDGNGNLVRTISTHGHGPEGIGFLNGKVWVANHHQDAPGTGGSVVELDPDSGALLAHVSVGAPIFCCGPQELIVQDGSVWTGVPNLNGVVRIDPTTQATTLIPGGNGGGRDPSSACGTFATDPATHGLWVSDGFCGPSAILSIDSSAGTLAQSINPGGVAVGLAFGDGALWASVADNGRGRSGFLVELDVATGVPVAKLATGGTGDIAFGDGSVYVEAQATGQILRVTQ